MPALIVVKRSSITEWMPTVVAVEQVVEEMVRAMKGEALRE